MENLGEWSPIIISLIATTGSVLVAALGVIGTILGVHLSNRSQIESLNKRIDAVDKNLDTVNDKLDTLLGLPKRVEDLENKPAPTKIDVNELVEKILQEKSRELARVSALKVKKPREITNGKLRLSLGHPSEPEPVSALAKK